MAPTAWSQGCCSSHGPQRRNNPSRRKSGRWRRGCRRHPREQLTPQALPIQGFCLLKDTSIGVLFDSVIRLRYQDTLQGVPGTGANRSLCHPRLRCAQSVTEGGFIPHSRRPAANQTNCPRLKRSLLATNVGKAS
jgi:hypothetical protein